VVGGKYTFGDRPRSFAFFSIVLGGILACGGLATSSDGGVSDAAVDTRSMDRLSTGDSRVETGPPAPDAVADAGRCGADGNGLITLATGLLGAAGSGLAVGTTNVYLGACSRSGSCGSKTMPTLPLLSVPLCGGSPTTIGTGPGGLPAGSITGIALNDTSVYWASFGTILTVSLVGGTVTTLVPRLDPYGEPSGNLAIDGKNVYWADPDEGAIMSVPLIGGTPATLVPGAPHSTPGEPGSVYYLAIDATSVFWVNNGYDVDGGVGGRGALLKMPLGGGAQITLGQAPSTPITLDATNLYFGYSDCPTDSGSCICDGGPCPWAMVKMPLDGGTLTTLASGLMEGVPGIAVDDENLYWTNCGACNDATKPTMNGTVLKVPLSGGKVTTMASGQALPQAIAVDETSVYWIDVVGAALMKFTPK
jgi:hypothetical protein